MEGYGNENPGAFQPTRPLRGATSAQCLSGMAWKLFQPTRPLRGATGFDLVPVLIQPISTHAPLAGRDLTSASTNRVQLTDFNPRAPCGARPGPLAARDSAEEISTHAPLAGRDSKSVQITMHIFAITDKFQMLLHRMPPVRAFCSFLMQENHADFGCEPPK